MQNPFYGFRHVYTEHCHRARFCSLFTLLFTEWFDVSCSGGISDFCGVAESRVCFYV